MLLISVHDMVGHTWSYPSVSQNKDTAIRDFALAFKRDGTLFHERPGDFALCVVGEWIVPFDDAAEPSVKPVDPPRLLATGDGVLS